MSPETKRKRLAYNRDWRARRRTDQPARPRGRPKVMPGDWRSRNYARCLFHRCKAAAKRKGLPFDLTVEFVERLVEPMRCAATDVRLIVAPRGERHPLLPSIDQVEAGLGYTVGNVRVVSWIFNRAKGSGTDADVLAMALALVTQSATRP